MEPYLKEDDLISFHKFELVSLSSLHLRVGERKYLRGVCNL